MTTRQEDHTDGFIGRDHNDNGSNHKNNRRGNFENDIEATTEEPTNNEYESNEHCNTYTEEFEPDPFEDENEALGEEEVEEASSTSTDGKWSLSVRLNSVVDLPSSIIPTMPLCPLMKFGLITVTEEEEVQDLEKSSAKSRRAEFEQTSSFHHGRRSSSFRGTRGSTTSSTSRNGGYFEDDSHGYDDDAAGGMNRNAGSKTENYSTQESLKMITTSGKKGILANFQEKDSLEECISKISSSNGASSSNSSSYITPTKIQYTSGKIMSKKDNGMMEWNEEMRWDDIEMPLQAVLCVELSAKAVFPPSIMSAMETLSSDFENNVSFHSQSGTAATVSGNVDEQQSNNGKGLLGFWRKGRNNRKNNQGVTTNSRGTSYISSNTSSFHGSDESGVGDYNDDTTQKEMEKAAAAAAVARYLMENHSKSDESEEKNDTKGSSNAGGGTGNGDNDDSDDNKMSIHDGDIRLGTLLIPISNLPLEEEVPTVEKWFQFDSVTEGSKSNHDNESISLPSNKGTTFRSPSALLQISLSNPDILDELEEDVYLALNGDGDGQEELQSLRDRPASVDFSVRSRKGSVDMDQFREEDEKRMEEIVRIQESGPYLEPGLIDHICVVGPEATGSARIDMNTKGWIGKIFFRHFLYKPSSSYNY